jgi:selenocysteine lyase/cysteine desulfurase
VTVARRRSPAPHRTPLSRRDFARMLSLGGSGALLAHPAFARVLEGRAPAPPVALAPPAGPEDEARWRTVREQFLMPPDLHLFNAANLCPAPEPVLRALSQHTRRMDATPSPTVREEMHKVKEDTRQRVARFLRVSPDEIVITRNTSEGNNFISNGLDLASGDEVVIFADNHPSNHAAWRQKAKRFGYAVRTIEQPGPHPGPEYYLDAVTRAITPRTRLVAFSHVSNTVGDLLPAKEICALAHARNVMTLVDGAQTFGAMDVNLRDMDPDFYTGSAHKWPCGPLEAGVLFVHARVQSRLWPSVISLYAGETGISKTFEGLGQRDEPSILAFGEAVAFQMQVGLPAIESRTRALARRFADGVRALAGVTVWTHPDPARSTSVVSFRPGTHAPQALAAALFERHGIVCAVRGGEDRGGLRFSPHFYNSMEEVDQAVAAIAEAMQRSD